MYTCMCTCVYTCMCVYTYACTYCWVQRRRGADGNIALKNTLAKWSSWNIHTHQMELDGVRESCTHVRWSPMEFVDHSHTRLMRFVTHSHTSNGVRWSSWIIHTHVWYNLWLIHTHLLAEILRLNTQTRDGVRDSSTHVRWSLWLIHTRYMKAMLRQEVVEVRRYIYLYVYVNN